ncbi:MAG: ribokinase [Propionibacterium sp.]|nr:ribokinase [Propionibacterium sp.]
MARVIVLGSINVDLEIKVPVHPHLGEKVIAEEFSRFAGGKGANQAVAARGAGAQVHMVGAVGTDESGRAYLNRLSNLGIHLHVERHTDAPTGIAFITTEETGANTIALVHGANARVAVRALEAIRNPQPDDLLLTQLEIEPEAVIAGVRQAVEYGWRVVLNLAPYETLPADVIAAADPLIIREKELPLLEADGLEPQSMVVTRGKRGASWGDITVQATVVPEGQVVDTIGAGDAFCGVLAAALSKGLDRQSALEQALSASAARVRQYGAQPNPKL